MSNKKQDGKGKRIKRNLPSVVRKVGRYNDKGGRFRKKVINSAKCGVDYMKDIYPNLGPRHTKAKERASFAALHRLRDGVLNRSK